MAQFYYDKYTTTSRKVVKSTYVGTAYVTNGYPSYNIVNDLFYHTGTYEYNYPGSLPAGRSVYETANGSGTIMRYDFVNANDVVSYRLELVPEPTKGSLVQSNIAAEDGTYPANGQHTDGFWYVKGAAVGPLPPDVIINQPYTTSAPPSKKIVILSNKWEVSVVRDISSGGYFFYVDKKDGQRFQPLCRLFDAAMGIYDIAMVAKGTDVHVIYGHGDTTIYHNKINVLTVTNTNVFASNRTTIHSGQINVSTPSLTIDRVSGYLHASWSTRHADLPNSFNVYYAKSTSSGSSWTTPLRITGRNITGLHSWNSSITTVNDVPIIAYQETGSPNGIYAIRFESGKFVTARIYPNNTYGDFNPTLVADKDGILHVVWISPDATSSGYYNVLHAKSSDNGATWSTPVKITNLNAKINRSASITTDKTGKLFVVFESNAFGANNLTDIVCSVSTNKGATWSTPQVIGANNGSSNNAEANVLYDQTFVTTFGEAPPTIYRFAASQIKYAGSTIVNTNPAITIVSPTNNQTLYENDTLNISGNAYDADKDQSVTAYYQINSEQRKVLATNLSQTQIALSKQLTFKGGKLYDGDNALTGTLADGVAHTLKVWAEDSEKASSANVERTFYVVPNRAPLLSVDAVVPSGVVDADKFKISGTASDQDANSTVKVTRRINAGNAVEIYSGTGGAWEFDLSLSQLVAGQNTIVIEVVDNYGAKTSKTITLNKNELKTPILQSVARYKITPPAGSAKGVLLFIERDEALNLKVELSMTLSGEQEQYETLTASNTAPMPNTNNIVEDTYYHEKTEPKDNIILKLSTTRPDATVNHKIHLISGAVE